MRKNSRKIVIAALLAAMVTAATYVIKIPFVGGYINFGDILVIISGWIAGPVYGALAAAIGSALCDVMAGYVAYVPATFIIKGLVAVTAFYGYRKIRNIFGMIFSAFVGEVLMVAGYFLFEALFMGLGWGALVSVPYNCIQGSVSFVGAAVLFCAISKNKYLKNEAEVLKKVDKVN